MPCDGPIVSTLLSVSDFVVHGPGDLQLSLPSLQLGAGEVAAVYGPSGGGKTSLLLALFGLLQRNGWTTAGRVQFREQDFPRDADAARPLLREQVVFLLQDAHSALDPLQPVGRQIEQATGCDAKAAAAMLGELGVADAEALCQRAPHAISGGQAQRVLLAIAFLRRPALVVADEPSASLDGGSYGELLVHLQALVAGGAAVLMATHDHRLLRDLQAKVLVLRQGSFVPGDPKEHPWPTHGALDIGSVPVLQGKQLRIAFGSRVVLDDVDFAVQRGEIVAVVGESGAGKTTLARLLAGHLQPDRGAVVRPDRPGAVQLVCQDAFGSLTPRRPLQGLLAEAAAPFFDARTGFASVQLPAALLTAPRERMSGGERKRAALLRALAIQPDVLVLDEPTASLDRATAVAVMSTLLQLQRSRALALVLVTHDLDLARTFAHRVIEVRGGRLCPL